MKLCKFLLVSCLPLWILPIRLLGSGLFVDAGGPRDIFFSTVDDKNAIDGYAASIDSSTEAASLAYFTPGPSNTLLAFKLTLTAVDGFDEILAGHHWPQVDFSLLGNTPLWGNENFTWTPNVTFTYAEMDLVDPNSKLVPIPITQREVYSGSFTNTLSAIVPGGSLAFSAGVKRDNNYSKLPQISIGDSGGKLQDGAAVASDNGVKTARIGTLKLTTDFPMYATYILEDTSPGLSEVFSRFPRFLLPQTTSQSVYAILLGPYAKLTPQIGGIPTHAFGCTLTIRALTNAKLTNGVQQPIDGKTPADEALVFPWSIFVENGTSATTGKASTSFGIQAIFQWK